jgi:hypothetical protein
MIFREWIRSVHLRYSSTITFKFASVNRLATSTVATSKVSSLNHKTFVTKINQKKITKNHSKLSLPLMTL